MKKLTHHRQAARRLLSQMSLAQKIGQMTLVDHSTCSAQDASQYAVGGVMSAAGSCPGDNFIEDWLSTYDEYWQQNQALAVAQPAIPLLFGLDAVHGNANVKGATVLPHQIGLGASDHSEDFQTVARITGDEVRAIGANWIFGPNLALANHYHWGRTYESVSESEHCVAEFARAYIAGLNHNRDDYQLLACAKHWVGDGGTLHGIEQGDSRIPFTELERHIKPFIAAIDAGVLSVMVSFSSWNGDKCHGHEYLISQQLKQTLGFQGFVLSDMHGISYVDDDFYKAVASSVNAGIDMFMVPNNWRQFQENLHKHVELGTVSERRINDAVERIVTVKLATGLMEQPRPSIRSQHYRGLFGSYEHRRAAKQVVKNTLVLLKNDKQLLPISKKAHVLVTGKSAQHTGNQCGGFTLTWQGVENADDIPGATSVWSGLKQEFTNAQFTSPDELSSVHAEQFDLGIVVVGERPYAEGVGDIRISDRILIEAGSQMDGHVTIQPPYGRSLALSDLHPEDLCAIQQVKASGIPTLVILLTGRPLIIDKEFNLADAFITAWLPGAEAGAIAEIIAGNGDFTGRLGFGWPTLSDHNSEPLPLINHVMPYKEIWPAGHGLSYGSTVAKAAKEVIKQRNNRRYSSQ